MKGIVGEIRLFGGNFAPRNWAFCEGQLLSISQNSSLFSIVGTTYGGDGRTTFALPDLRGRSAVHAGTGPGLTTRTLGQRLGNEHITLTVQQLPSHNHTLLKDNLEQQTIFKGVRQAGTASDPSDNLPAATSSGYMYGHVASTNMMAVDMISHEGQELAIEVFGTGGGGSHDNMQPALGVYYIICLVGILPGRS